LANHGDSYAAPGPADRVPSLTRKARLDQATICFAGSCPIRSTTQVIGPGLMICGFLIDLENLSQLRRSVRLVKKSFQGRPLGQLNKSLPRQAVEDCIYR